MGKRSSPDDILMRKRSPNLDVSSIPLNTTDPVAHVGVPVELHVPQVPHLHVSVVVAGSDHPLCERVRAVRVSSVSTHLRVGVTVAGRHCPALPLAGLGLHRDDGPLGLPQVPDLHTPLPASRDEL